MEGIQVEERLRLDRDAAPADLLDHDRLEDRDFPLQFAQYGDAILIPLVTRHRLGL
jgi:hypothetical protein